MRLTIVGLAVAMLALATLGVRAGELVGVSGSSTQYPTPVDRKVGDRQVKMVLTGTALRTKLLFNVYAIGSYLEESVKVGSAEELASVDAAKLLHLYMERDVDGQTMADAFKTAIRANYAEPAFNDEIATLGESIRSISLKKHDSVYLTHVPRVGLHVHLVGKADVTIKNVAFAKAIWEIYLGKNNLGDGIKKGLVSRI